MPVLFEDTRPAHKKKTVPTKSETPKKMRLFQSFALNPLGVRFETQKETEAIILFLRQHLILLIPWLVVGGVLCIAPTFLFPLIIRLLPDPLVVPTQYIIVITVFWYVASFGFILTKFLRWFFNIFIVTDRRVIDIDFINLLYKEFSEGEISRIQDLTYQTKGILATFFDYGDVLVQTAGEIPNFVFESVPHPGRVVEVLSGLVKKAKQEL